jgi:hypothetical protein
MSQDDHDSGERKPGEDPGSDLGGDYARDTHRGGYGDDYARDGGWSGGGSSDQHTREPQPVNPDAPKDPPPSE